MKGFSLPQQNWIDTFDHEGRSGGGPLLVGGPERQLGDQSDLPAERESTSDHDRCGTVIGLTFSSSSYGTYHFERRVFP